VHFGSDLELTLESAEDYSLAVTVYSGYGCSGESSVVYKLEMNGDDSVVLDSEGLSIGGNVRSVYIKADSDAELQLLPINGNYNDVETIPSPMSNTDPADEPQTCFDVSTDNAGNISKLKLQART
jgi:hypothetical protein